MAPEDHSKDLDFEKEYAYKLRRLPPHQNLNE
jgi:hypothetical protein